MDFASKFYGQNENVWKRYWAIKYIHIDQINYSRFMLKEKQKLFI